MGGRWFERFGPADAGSNFDRLRLRLVVLSSLLAPLSFGAFAVRQWLVGDPTLAMIDSAATAIFVINLVALRAHRNVELAAHVLVGVIFIGLTVLTRTSGGLGMPAPFLFCALPIAATALVGRPSAMIGWTAASLLVLGYVWWLHATGYEFPAAQTSAPDLVFVGAMGGVLVTSFLAYLGTHLQNRALTDLEVANRGLAQAKDAARAASEAKSSFLANMSHEIRTPMNGILGSLQLLHGREDLPDEGRELTETAMRSAHALLSLLDDIIDLAKVEAGKMAFESVRYDARRLVADVAGLFGPSGRDKGLEVTAAPGEPLWVFGDPVRARQILTNLVGNAVKFTEEGEVRVELRADEGWLRFDVVDTGIGISAEKQASIFDAFEQADASTTRVYGGTGLGLAVSKRLVEGMGGRLELDSAPRRGARFTVRLPLEIAPAPTPTSRPTEVVPEVRGGLVLVVEDNRINQLVARRMLERLGYDVRTCEDGAAAVEEALTADYGAILMDCHMPRMDGFEATRALRAQAVRTPIIALTASAMQADREECAAAGMDDFLPKPIEQAARAKMLARWVPSVEERPPSPVGPEASIRR